MTVATLASVLEVTGEWVGAAGATGSGTERRPAQKPVRKSTRSSAATTTGGARLSTQRRKRDRSVVRTPG
jgi:hypothetical protein